MIWWGSTSKHHEDTCLKEIRLCLQILITTLHSTMNTIKRTHVSGSEINKHAFPITITKLGTSDFQSNFCTCFIADLLMQHGFCCVHLIGRSWRTWKANHIHPNLDNVTFVNRTPWYCYLKLWNPFSYCKTPLLLSLPPLTMSLFFPKICNVSVMITRNMDEKGRMYNKFYGWHRHLHLPFGKTIWH